MASSISRNDPCPCGSGKKYKHCHIGQELEVKKRTKGLIFGLVCLIGLVAGIVVWQAQNIEVGLGVFLGIVVVGGMVIVFRDPPPPNANPGDPAGLNFGK